MNMLEPNFSVQGDVSRVFDLPTGGTRGPARGITLTPDALSWNSRYGPYSRSYADIASIGLALDPGGDPPFAECAITFASSERLKVEVTHDKAGAKDVDVYLELIPQLFAALGPDNRARIRFQHGSGPIARLVELVLIAGAAIVLIAVMIHTAISGEYQEDNGWLLFPLAGFSSFCWLGCSTRALKRPEAV